MINSAWPGPFKPLTGPSKMIDSLKTYIEWDGFYSENSNGSQVVSSPIDENYSVTNALTLNSGTFESGYHYPIIFVPLSGSQLDYLFKRIKIEKDDVEILNVKPNYSNNSFIFNYQGNRIISGVTYTTYLCDEINLYFDSNSTYKFYVYDLEENPLSDRYQLCGDNDYGTIRLFLPSIIVVKYPVGQSFRPLNTYFLEIGNSSSDSAWCFTAVNASGYPDESWQLFASPTIDSSGDLSLFMRFFDISQSDCESTAPKNICNDVSTIPDPTPPNSPPPPSNTPTPTITPSITPTISVTPSITPTNSVTPSITPTSVTPSVTPTITLTPSITPTVTTSPLVDTIYIRGCNSNKVYKIYLYGYGANYYISFIHTKTYLIEQREIYNLYDPSDTCATGIVESQIEPGEDIIQVDYNYYPGTYSRFEADLIGGNCSSVLCTSPEEPPQGVSTIYKHYTNL
jgi:hypothetical protein